MSTAAPQDLSHVDLADPRLWDAGVPSMDTPHHDRLKKLVGKAFTPGRIAHHEYDHIPVRRDRSAA